MIPTAFVAGFFAGFFGIGGGLITVPILFYIFGALGLDELYTMHLAIGTSFSILIPTAIVSVSSDYIHIAVVFNIVKTYCMVAFIGVII